MLGISLSLATSNILSSGGGGGGGTSTAHLTTGTGASATASRSLYVNATSYQTIVNTDIGASCFDRASTAASNGKFHCEFTATAFQGGAHSFFVCGFDDGSPDLHSPGYILDASLPGTTGVSGFTVKAIKGTTAGSIAINGNNSVNLTLPSNATDGDTFAFDIDSTATNPTVRITYYSGGVATVLNGGSAFVISTGKPTTWNAIMGGGTGTGTAGVGVSDTGGFNPGNATNLVTPQINYGVY